MTDTTKTAAKRPTTCDAIAKLDPTLGEAGCKRLPRHGGEHRPFRTASQARKAAAAAAKPVKAPKGRKIAGQTAAQIAQDLRTAAGQVGRKRLTAVQRRAAFAALAALVDGGSIKAGDALSVAAKLA